MKIIIMDHTCTGKSTLAKLIADTIRPYVKSIEVLNEDTPERNLTHYEILENKDITIEMTYPNRPLLSPQRIYTPKDKNYLSSQ